MSDEVEFERKAATRGRKTLDDFDEEDWDSDDHDAYEDEPEPSPKLSARQWLWVAGVLGMLSIAGCVSIFDETISVTIGHDLFRGVATCGAAAMMVLGGVLLFWRVEDSSPAWRLKTMATWGLVFGSWAFVDMIKVTDRIAQHWEFPANTPQSELLFPIADEPDVKDLSGQNRQDRHQDDDTISMAGLVGVVGPVVLANSDARYLKAERDKGSRHTYCLRAKVQQSGDALRIMHAPMDPFPAGSVERCPEDLPAG